MKRLLLLLAVLSSTSQASTVDELIEHFELENIYSADWYEDGTSKIAESSNKYRDIKVNLADDKGSILVTLTPESDMKFAILPCYKLTKYIDYNKADTWNDPETDDEKLIHSIFNAETSVGQENNGDLNGWSIQFKRLPTGFTCMVAKQADQ